VDKIKITPKNFDYVKSIKMAAEVTTLEELRKCPYKTTIWSVIRKNLPDCKRVAVWPNTSYIENMEKSDTWTKI